MKQNVSLSNKKDYLMQQKAAQAQPFSIPGSKFDTLAQHYVSSNIHFVSLTQLFKSIEQKIAASTHEKAAQVKQNVSLSNKKDHLMQQKAAQAQLFSIPGSKFDSLAQHYVSSNIHFVSLTQLFKSKEPKIAASSFLSISCMSPFFPPPVSDRIKDFSIITIRIAVRFWKKRLKGLNFTCFLGILIQ